MTLSSLIRRVVVQWQLRMLRRESRREFPGLKQLDRQEALYRRDHKRGSARIIREKRRIIEANLRGERRV